MHTYRYTHMNRYTHAYKTQIQTNINTRAHRGWEVNTWDVRGSDFIFLVFMHLCATPL